MQSFRLSASRDNITKLWIQITIHHLQLGNCGTKIAFFVSYICFFTIFVSVQYHRGGIVHFEWISFDCLVLFFCLKLGYPYLFWVKLLLLLFWAKIYFLSTQRFRFDWEHSVIAENLCMNKKCASLSSCLGCIICFICFIWDDYNVPSHAYNLQSFKDILS